MTTWWWLWPLLLGAWAAWDIQALMRWQTDLNSLAAAGRFERIAAHCNGMLHTWRPFVRLLRALTMPGIVEAMCALQFHTLGDHARALELAQHAERLTRQRPTSLASALAVQVLALTGLRRFDEGNAVFARLCAIPEAAPGLLSSGAMLMMSQGRFADAMDACRAALAREPKDEAAHVALSAAHLERGEMDAALKELEYEPRGAAAAHHSPEDLARLRTSDEGRALLAASEASRSAVVRPTPYIQAALVHLEVPDVNAAQFALSRAAAVLGNHPGINLHFHAASARLAALQSDVPRAEKHLAQGAATLLKLPQARGLALEWRLAEARVLLPMHRPAQAVECLQAAQQLNPTPLHSHHVHGLWAEAAAALGDTVQARQHAQAVLDDGIPGLVTTRARALVERLGPA